MGLILFLLSLFLSQQICTKPQQFWSITISCKFMPVIKAATHFVHLILLIFVMAFTGAQPNPSVVNCAIGTVMASCSKIINVTNGARGPCFQSKMADPQISLKEISTCQKHSQWYNHYFILINLLQ